MRIRRLDEQVALLKAVDEALRDFLTIGGPLASSAACKGITTMTIGCASQSRSGPLRIAGWLAAVGKRTDGGGGRVRYTTRLWDWSISHRVSAHRCTGHAAVAAAQPELQAHTRLT